MIVWSGRGFLIVLIFVACMFLGNLIFPKGMADYVFIFTGLVLAIFCWIAGMAWNTKKDRMVTDDETGQKILLKGGGHNFFWIPMQYWGIIFAILTIVILFQNSMWLAIGATVVFCTIIFIYQMKKLKENKNESTMNSEPKQPEGVETEEERLKRRAEKEDHSRFMPK